MVGMLPSAKLAVAALRRKVGHSQALSWSLSGSRWLQMAVCNITPVKRLLMAPPSCSAHPTQSSSSSMTAGDGSSKDVAEEPLVGTPDSKVVTIALFLVSTAGAIGS